MFVGVPGIEPGNRGFKVPCRTAWLYPKMFDFLTRTKSKSASPSRSAGLDWFVGNPPRTAAIGFHSFRHTTDLGCRQFPLLRGRGLYLLPPSMTLVPWTGFEPVTRCLEGNCSIQLSYQGIKKDSSILYTEISKVKHYNK